MRKTMLITSALIFLVVGTLRACGGPTPATIKLINGILGPSSAATTHPLLLRVPYLAGFWTEMETRTPETRSALEKLDISRPSAEQLGGVAELERRKAVGCLLVGLSSANPDVRIRAARALALAADAPLNPAAVRLMLDHARQAAVFEAGSENATLHGVYQHALAESLNKLTHSSVRLKPGQDPEGLKAGIVVWLEGLDRLQEQQTAPPAP
jgi:hypothetical protein